MSYLSITNIKLISKISDDEFDSDALESKINSFRQELSALLGGEGFTIKSIESEFLNEKKYSICKCHGCSELMINRDENPVGYDAAFIEDVVLNGGIKDDKVLCEMCLPREHRWSSLG